MILRSVGRCGFTLLEMLVALALMGVLATGLYMSLTIAFNARARAEAAVVPVRSAALVVELMRGDITSALPPTGILAGGFVGQDAKADGSASDADSLVFHAVVEDAGRAAPGICRIELVLTPVEEGSGSILVRHITENLLAPTTPEPTEEVLCRNVMSLNFRYFDGIDWLDSWDSSVRENALPLAVEVRIRIGLLAGTPQEEHAAPEDGQEYELTRVLLLPCGGSRITTGRAGEQESR